MSDIILGYHRLKTSLFNMLKSIQRSTTRAKLEYPTVDVSFASL
jgi:hypothetical protein